MRTCLIFGMGLICLTVMPLLSCTPAPAPAPEPGPEVEAPGPLEGAWRVTERVTTGGEDAGTISSPQPSLYIFAKQHYSIMYVPGDNPRELFTGDAPVIGTDEPTDAEKIASWDTFIANSGTYEISGSTLTTRPIVAKNPNFMSGGYTTMTYQLDGDTLKLTLKPPWVPDIEIITTLVRID